MVHKEDIVSAFLDLCHRVNRRGLIGFSPLRQRKLLPEQEAYLARKLGPMLADPNATAVSIGLFYREEEIRAIPDHWVSRVPADGLWNDYARAYAELNQSLNRIVVGLADRFGGVAEQATIEGWVDRIAHVRDYFPACVSHRAFAEAAGLGWRGKNGLIITPEVGPALRFATLFLPYPIPAERRELPGCGDCQACAEVCPILRKGQAEIQILRESGYLPTSPERTDYREACRRRLGALGLEHEVCGICIRVCWESIQRFTH